MEPEIALICRELYYEQPTGEWLRFATPFNSMVDSDGVSHLPKLGKALNFSLLKLIGLIQSYFSSSMSLYF